MSRIRHIEVCAAHSSGNWFSPTLIELPRWNWRSARSKPHSISLRTTVSSIGIDFSAAVAARSAGCSYALDEMFRYGSMLSGRVSGIAVPQRSVLRAYKPAIIAPDEILGGSRARMSNVGVSLRFPGTVHDAE